MKTPEIRASPDFNSLKTPDWNDKIRSKNNSGNVYNSK